MSSQRDPVPGVTAPSARARAAVLLLLATAVCAVFAGALGNGWVLFDDPQYVFGNPHVIHGLSFDSVSWFLLHGHDGNWDPLPSWSHLLDVQLFGLAPAGHHATSVLLHALNAVLLVLALSRLTGAWWRSVLVGALFALHPLRVESVAWIAERKDVLSGTFFLLALLAYGRWAERPRAARYALVALAFALGLMCKPMLVTLPIVLVLLDVWPLGRLRGTARAAGAPRGRAPSRSLAGLVAEKWPLFALAAASTVVTFLVQREANAVASLATLPLARRLPNAMLAWWRYVAMTVWPSNLCVFYPYPRQADVVGAWLAAGGLAAVTALAFRAVRTRPYLLVGWLWYAIMLLPVCGLAQVGGHAYADRFTYLPTIGLGLVLAWGLGDLFTGRRVAANVVAGAAVVVLALLSIVTVRQVATWKDTITLFTHALRATRDNPTANNYVGSALYVAGRPAEAIPYFEETLRLQPDYPEARNFLASALGAAGRDEEAAAQFEALLAERPTAAAHFNLGYLREREGQPAQAIAEYQAALGLDPAHAPSRARLDALVAASGGPTAHPAAPASPDTAGVETHRERAVALIHAGRVEDAIREYERILHTDPYDLDALNNIAWIRATHAEAAHRNGAEAVRLAKLACDRSPQPVAVLYSTLAAAYAEAGRFPDAVKAGERAVALADSAKSPEEADRYAKQLALYRAGKPNHAAP